MKFIRLSLLCFLFQWMHLQGFLAPSFLRRDLSERLINKRIMNVERMRTAFVPSFQLQMAKKKDPLDDFLGPSDDEEPAQPKSKKITSNKKPQVSPAKVTTAVQDDEEELEEEVDLDQYDDEIFEKYLRELNTDDTNLGEEKNKANEEEEEDDDDDFDEVDESSLARFGGGDGTTEEGKKQDDGVIRDGDGKVIQLSNRVNRLLQKLPFDPKFLKEAEVRLLNETNFRGEFINFGERFLRFQARKFEKYLENIYEDPERIKEHLHQLETDAEYQKEYEYQLENLDEERVRRQEKEFELERQLLPFVRVINELRTNETFREDFARQLRNDPELEAAYQNTVRIYAKFTAKRQGKLEEFKELMTEIMVKNNTQLEEKIATRLSLDPYYAESFKDYFNQMQKLAELEVISEDLDLEEYTGKERVVVVPEGFLIKRFEPTNDNSEDEEEEKVDNIILQLPQTTKFATYSKLPDDGRLVFTMQPYEDAENPRKSDLSELMVVFHESIELQIVEPEFTLDEDDEWYEDGRQPVGILRVPKDVIVIETPAERMIGDITSVLTPKGIKVIRPRPDSLEVEPGEIILCLPKEITVEPMVGVFPKSQLIIEARKDKKYPVYYLSQNVTVRALLPEDAEKYPKGIIIVPPLTAVSSKAHELIDYNFKARYLQQLPNDLRQEIGTAWDFEPKDQEEMQKIEKLKALQRSSSKLDTEGESELEFEPDPRSADSWGADIDWPRTIEKIDELKNIPEHFPVYCLLYFIRNEEINDLLQFEYDKHEQFARSFPRLVYHDVVRTEEYMNSYYKIPEFEGLFHFFVGKENEWEETIDEVETFIATCPLKASGKVEKVRVIAFHEIDGERGRTPARFKDWKAQEEIEIPEEEAIAQILRQYDADLPEKFRNL